MHDVADWPRVRDPRGRHQQPEEAGGEVRDGVGAADRHPQGGRHVQGPELLAQVEMTTKIHKAPTTRLCFLLVVCMV